jgi:hypothetical protein
MRRRKHKPPATAGAWTWHYDGRRLRGIVQQVGNQWRGIRVGLDGHDRRSALFRSRAEALAFINNDGEARHAER